MEYDQTGRIDFRVSFEIGTIDCAVAAITRSRERVLFESGRGRLQGLVGHHPSEALQASFWYTVT